MRMNKERWVLFKNRIDAGQQLANQLERYADRPNLIILALPRGGVPVGFEIAQKLHAPLDTFLVRKLGVPGQEELAMGAIATGGVRVLNRELIERLHIPRERVEQISETEERELHRREKAYRGERPVLNLEGKIVILVDDGLATGASMYAAVLAVRELRPVRVVVAVPTAAEETCASFDRVVDEIICMITPAPFYGVGAWYEDFAQVSDEEVRDLLRINALEFPIHPSL